MRSLPEHLKPKYDAKAKDEAIVRGDKYRFSILTSRLIRMEYADDGIFEDGATQSVICRNFEDVDFEVTENENELTITTEHLTLLYKKTGRFCGSNLRIRLTENPSEYQEAIWCFGDACKTLGGTARTLDTCDGACPISEGVCSISGFATVDDSASALILESGMIEPRKADIIDIYFFGYGHKYLDAVRDLMKLSGRPPLLPAYALGNWWSRYYPYRQQEYIELMERFIKENVPFSVAVIDMDWHKVNIPKKYGSGWTGYSWNTDLIPDYKALLNWLHEHNLRVTLNLHPALGVRGHEDMYNEMALAMGMDPEKEEPIVFDMTNEEFIKAYFEILHKPYEKDGVDFWWMDWQQGTKSAIEGLDPLWLLNHYHILDIAKNDKRPMLLSRYSGIGSQRFPIGFSGDTHITWDSLDFQPYFTLTASNVAYPWWSHDIGGHFGGYKDDMLAIRWNQLGVFSPINRLHSSNSPFSGKEPWNYSKEAEYSIKKFLRLRHSLFPYIYTMNWRVHNELIPLICPLYYYHSEDNFCYNQKFRNSFYFGSEMAVFPITTPSDPVSNLGCVNAFLPEGEWIDFFTGAHYNGGRTLTFYRNSDEYPVLCKAGAIIPCNKAYDNDNSIGICADIELYIFPEADNTFTLYEDAGEGYEYQNGQFATTEYNLKWGKTATFTINAAKGDLSLLPQKRNYKVLFRGVNEKACISARLDGKDVAVLTSYEKETSTLIVNVKDIAVDKALTIIFEFDGETKPTTEAAYMRIYDILLKAQCDYSKKNPLWPVLLDSKLTTIEKINAVVNAELGESLTGAIVEQLRL